MSSSPSTRFDGNDIDGLKEDELEYPKKFLQVIWLPIRVHAHSQFCSFARRFNPLEFVNACSSMRFLNKP